MQQAEEDALEEKNKADNKEEVFTRHEYTAKQKQMIKREVKIRAKTNPYSKGQKSRGNLALAKRRTSRGRADMESIAIKHKNRNLKTLESFVMIQQLK